jgi:aminoglycoside phosphotransferase (APT) family kinase protein
MGDLMETRSDARQWPDNALFMPAELTPPQDWRALSDHLAKYGLNFDADVVPRRFRGGHGNLNYLVSIDGAPAVLRRPPLGKLPPKANDMAREYRALSVLAPAWSLVPRALHYCESAEVLGAPFLISEYRDGLPLHGPHPLGTGKMSPALAASLSRMQIDILAHLHQLDIGAIGADQLGRSDNFAERTRAGWSLRLAAISDSPPEEASAVFAWLETKRPPTEAVRIIHNDFKLDNILVDRAYPTVPVALLDWDMVTLGDPYFDLATLLSYWVAPEDPSPLRAFNTTPSETPGALSRAELVDAYSRATGVALDPQRLLYFRVLAYAKLGVLLMQLYKRYRGDTESALPNTQFAAAIVPAFEMGLRLTQGALG